MKKTYLSPSLTVAATSAESALLASSYIPIGGDTDHFDVKRNDWDIFGDTAEDDADVAAFDF